MRTKHSDKREIGSTGVYVSALALGTSTLGNLYKTVDRKSAEEVVEQALASGISYYDTAPFYGFGLSERRVGDILRDQAGIVISSKVGRLLRRMPEAPKESTRNGFVNALPFDPEYDYSYDGIMRSFEDSCLRMGRTEIDVLLVHDIGSLTHADQAGFYFDQFFKGGGYKALTELKDQRATKAIGLGVNETAICEECMEVGQFDCFLLAGRYTLLEQEPLNGFFDKCQKHGASILLGGPYNSGILATGARISSVPFYNYVPASEQVIKKVQSIEAIGDRFGVTLSAAALQLPAAHPVVASVVPGLGNPSRVKQTVDLFNEIIPVEYWQALKSEGLIAAQTPTPA